MQLHFYLKFHHCTKIEISRLKNSNVFWDIMPFTLAFIKYPDCKTDTLEITLYNAKLLMIELQGITCLLLTFVHHTKKLHIGEQWPGDLKFLDYQDERIIFADLTVVHSLYPSNQALAASKIGVVIERREQEKHSKYDRFRFENITIMSIKLVFSHLNRHLLLRRPHTN